MPDIRKQIETLRAEIDKLLGVCEPLDANIVDPKIATIWSSP